MKTSPILKTILVTLVLCTISVVANAQCDPFFDPNCVDVDIVVPLDDHLIPLIAASAFLGFIFLSKRNAKMKAIA